ncbi:MAG: hypothetical protein AB9907_14825 [Flexilinea sp.]
MHRVITINDIEPGESFGFAAIDWTLLDKTAGKALCLMTGQTGPLPFDSGAKNDYVASSLRFYLEQHFLKILLANGAKQGDFISLQLDLSRDGERDPVILEAGIGLLSWRQCQKYQNRIPKTGNEWFWTCTKSAGIHGDGVLACPGVIKDAFGYFRGNDAKVSVRPVICLRNDVFVEGL